MPDLRSDFSDTNSFWYQRNIYNDILYADLAEVTVQSLDTTQHLDKSLELQCKSVRISFQVSEKITVLTNFKTISL